MLPPAAELRTRSRLHVQAAKEATDLNLKRRLAAYASALAQIAEQAERKLVDEVAASVLIREHEDRLAELVGDEFKSLLSPKS
jgi:hypothetical protein